MELSKKNIRAITLGAMGCIVLYWLLNEPERWRGLLDSGLSLLSPFLVGGCLAFIFNVPMRSLENAMKQHSGIKSTRTFAILLTVVLLVTILSIVVYLLVPQVESTIYTIADQMPAFLNRIEAGLQEFFTKNPEVLQWLMEYTDFENIQWMDLLRQAGDLLGKSLTAVFDRAVSVVGNAISGVWSVFVSVAFCLYCLGNKEQLARQGRLVLYAFVPERFADEVVRVMRLINTTFSNFLSGQCIEVCILGGMFAVSMSLFRMPYVPLVSVLVAVTAFVPILGAWIGCVLGAFFILVNNPLQALWFIVLFLVLQQIENNVIYPRVVGTSVGLPSMWVLFSVTVGGKLMGVAGMVLMIPVVSVIYSLLRDYTGILVRKRNVPQEKLKQQPPELRSHLKEKREIVRKKRQKRKAEKLARMVKENLHIPGKAPEDKNKK